ncbi:hypothetical protein C9374_007028 [Naegleria lovaniensis]|uniref:Serine incorporator n=1 Tax=Naegleria lovaniensis TaxID=51637 RepID=A0AA88H6A3_NAELO|nr:uncharacterized protein C9374_007028 [Naegleria lovaniensis]KAG2393497.1 hypothetical protein C9374_007028 [Naegleria lovaniensis]
MKRRLLKVVEHDPDTNKDEIEYRKILQEFQNRNREEEEITFSDTMSEMLYKFGLKDYKPLSPKYQVIYTKIKYCLFVIFGFLMSLLYQSGKKSLNPLLIHLGLPGGLEDVPVVIHFIAISLTMFFGFHAVLCSPLVRISPRTKNQLQTMHFLKVKIPLFLLCLAAPYSLIPESVINFYVTSSKYLLFVFMVLQSIFIIDFAYRWGRSWQEEDDWRWDTALISISCIFIVSTVAIFVASFFYSGFKTSGCLLNFYVTIFTCILSFILLIASLFTEHSSLFSGSMITFYIATISLNVIVSKPITDKMCSLSGGYPVTLAAMLFTTVAAIYSSIYSTTGIQFLLHFLWYGEEPEEDEQHDFVKNDSSLNNSYFFFHVFMALCSCYVTTFFQDFHGWTELGVQAFFLLFTIAMYGWSLMAPYVLYWRRFD